MGKLLEKVIEEASKLPEQEQEAFAAAMLAELESERRWDDLFARSQDLLAELAEEARQEYRAGLTEPLDPRSCEVEDHEQRRDPVLFALARRASASGE